MNYISKRISILLKLLVILSVPALTFVISYLHRFKFRVFTAGLAFLIIIIIVSRVKLEKLKLVESGVLLLIASYIDKLLIGLYSVKFGKIIKLVYKYTEIKVKYNLVYFAVSMAIFFGIFFFVYLFYKKIWPVIVDFFKNLTKSERVFLTITSIFAVILCGIVVYNTIAFGVTPSKWQYDVIYSSDSSEIVKKDAWLSIPHPENDIRQPLFGVFGFPFAVAGHFLSDVLFFVPKGFSYEYVMMVFQYIILAVSIILFARLIEKKEKNKKYVFMLFGLSFPYLLFGMILEQYVLCIFYLSLCLYAFFNDTKFRSLAYVGAVGTLLTSGVLILYNKWKEFKTAILNVLKIIGTGIAVTVLSGQFVIVFNLKDQIDHIVRFASHGVPFINRVEQFLYFARSLFVAPHGYITNDNLFTKIKFPSYQLVNVHTISIIGIVVLAIMLLSLIINHKDKMAITSFLWIIFSFIVLVCVGWGTYENGLILYSLYFSWAFYTLFYKLFKHKILLLIPIAIFFVLNSIEIYNILRFAFTYYIR